MPEQVLAAEVMVLVMAPALVSQVKPESPAASSMALSATLAPEILVARAFVQQAMLARASLLLDQPQKMARPALPPADWRRPTPADKH